MYVLPLAEAERVLERARSAFPREACGVLLKRQSGSLSTLFVVPTSTEENTPLSFTIRDAAYRHIEETLCGPDLEICGCFHTHPWGGVRASRRDRKAIKERGDLWLIYSFGARALKLYRWNGQAFRRQRFRIAA